MNIAILAGLIGLWGVVHSLLASVMVKDFLRGVVGNRAMRAYRFLYNVFALVSFAPIPLVMRSLPDRSLYTISAPWIYWMLAGQGLAAAFLLVILLQTGVLAFAGLRQFFEGEGAARLVTGGFYRLVRHPLYLFGLLFLWLTPIMTVNRLVVYVPLTVYLFVGAYFEERKLSREFGAAYVEYKSRTPMILPGLRFKQNK